MALSGSSRLRTSLTTASSFAFGSNSLEECKDKVVADAEGDADTDADAADELPFVPLSPSSAAVSTPCCWNGGPAVDVPATDVPCGDAV